MKKINTLVLYQEYSFDQLEQFANSNTLYEKHDGLLDPFCNSDFDGEIGEITLPLYFESGEVAANFILTGYGQQSIWRCIYVCQTFSLNGKHEI